MKTLHFLIALIIIFKIEIIVAQNGAGQVAAHGVGGVGDALINGFVQNKKEKNRIERAEKTKQAKNAQVRQLEKESIYWQVISPQSVKDLTGVSDSLNSDFILYCNIQIEDKALGQEYYYTAKILELYEVFVNQSIKKEN